MPTLPKSKPLPWIVKSKPFEGAARSFNYSSTSWKRARALKRKMNPLCELCEENGIIKEAACVDHIVSIASGGNPFDMANLQSLCRDCHAAKTNREIADKKRREQGV